MHDLVAGGYFRVYELVGATIMPIVLVIGPYRFYFFSGESNESQLGHVDSADSSAKFWLSPEQLSRTVGFSAREVRVIQTLVEKHQRELLEAWNGYFG